MKKGYRKYPSDPDYKGLGCAFVLGMGIFLFLFTLAIVFNFD